MENTKEYTIQLDDVAASFFERVAQSATLPVEQVLADALFQYAGQLSVQAIQQKSKPVM